MHSALHFSFPDSRIMSYLPSVLAVAAMIHVISEIEPLNAMKHRNQLMGLLKISEVCVYNFISTPAMFRDL